MGTAWDLSSTNAGSHAVNSLLTMHDSLRNSDVGENFLVLALLLIGDRVYALQQLGDESPIRKQQ